MHARVVLWVGKMSCLERCPQFRSVLIEVYSWYILMENNTHIVCSMGSLLKPYHFHHIQTLKTDFCICGLTNPS